MPWSRHDRAFLLAAVAIALLALVARVGSLASFGAYPELHGAWDAAPWTLAAAIVVLPLLPFLDRRGIA